MRLSQKKLYFCSKIMKPFTNSQKISVMRVLLDIIYADNRVDYRETALFKDLVTLFELSSDVADMIEHRSAIISLLDIKEMDDEQKEYIAVLMDKMIKVDEDININEVAIYDIVIDYCKIQLPFNA